MLLRRLQRLRLEPISRRLGLLVLPLPLRRLAVLLLNVRLLLLRLLLLLVLRLMLVVREGWVARDVWVLGGCVLNSKGRGRTERVVLV